jgi:hypothetical protein
MEVMQNHFFKIPERSPNDADPFPTPTGASALNPSVSSVRSCWF